MGDNSLKVLLVEDNAGDARLIEEMLADCPVARFELDRADRLAAALELLGNNSYDLVLLDLGLPDSSGTDTVVRLQAVAPGLPIIVLTGLADEAVGLQAIQTGAQDYLVKGQADAKLLTTSIRFAIERRRAETQRRELEEQLHQAQKMEAVGRLASGISHDFNNILGAVSGYAELVKQVAQQTTPKLANYADQILKAADRGADLATQLLAFSRQARIRQVPVDVNKTIEEVVSLLERTVDPRITIEQESHAEKSIVMGDGSQLTNALLNLGINARDAMPEGGTLTLRTESASANPGAFPHDQLEGAPAEYLCIVVTDTGTGMDNETLRKLFEPFFTTKELGRGTGLGLAGVYGTLQQHKGHITVESTPGRGTTFRVYLPLAPQGQAPEQTREPQQPRTARGSGNVLLVDDDEMVRGAAREMLRSIGYEVMCCNDGDEALSLYEQNGNGFDVVVLDIVMPRLDGVACLRELKRINPDIVVVAVSGYSDKAKETEILQEGARAFLRKPFHVSELTQTLSKALASTHSGSVQL